MRSHRLQPGPLKPSRFRQRARAHYRFHWNLKQPLRARLRADFLRRNENTPFENSLSEKAAEFGLAVAGTDSAAGT